MALTTTQLSALATAINADPAALALWQAGNPGGVADYYNTTAAPAFVIWRDDADPNEIMQNGIVWADFKNLSVGQISIWELMTQKGFINATKLNERLGLDEAFGKNSATVAGLQSHLKRNATRAEKLFATGTGTTADPATPAFSGSVDFREVIAAMNL